MHKIDRDLGVFTYNDKSSKDFDIIVEKLPSLNRPQRQHDIYKVPGRSGDIIEQYNAYENITITYEVWFSNNDINVFCFGKRSYQNPFSKQKHPT